MANPSAPFVQSRLTGHVVVTAAAGNLASDAPTGLSLLVIAGAGGAEIDSVTAIARSTVTGSSLLLYSSKDSGVTFQLIGSKAMTGYTRAVGQAAPTLIFDNIGTQNLLHLMPNERLYVASEVAQASGIAFRAQGGNYAVGGV